MNQWLSNLILSFFFIAQVDSQCLIQCRELMSRYLISQRQTSSAHMYLANVNPITTNKPTKRKVEQIEEDDIYDGIKRLYNDYEENDHGAVTVASCGLEACQDTSTALPLQAVAN